MRTSFEIFSSAMRERLGALEERPFRLLWTGQAASAAGDALVPVALAFAVIGIRGSASDLGLVLAAFTIARAGLIVVGGVWADRLPRQLVMLAADLVRAAVQGTVAVLLISGRAELWQLVVTGVLSGAASAFFMPASTGLVPDTVSPARLQQANALMGLTRSAIGIGGPIVSGLIVAGFGPGWVFAVDSVSYIVSAAYLARLRIPAGRPKESRESFARELAGGWHELRSRTWVWTSIVYFSIWNLAIAPFFVLGPLVFARELGGASSWGLNGTGAALGGVVGGAIALRLKPRRPLVCAYLLLSVSALQPALLTFPAPVWMLVAAAALAVNNLVIGNTLWLTVLQERIPRDAISRVSAYDWMGSLVFMPVGFAIAGPAADAIGIDTTLWITAAVLLGSNLAIVLVPSVRRIERLEPAVEPA